MNLVRRFTRKVQEYGIIHKVKSKRYNQRVDSKLKTKVATLKKIDRKAKYEKLEKLGKAPVRKRRGRR